MNNTIEHQVVDGTKLSIQFYPKVGRLHFSAIDSNGRGTSSITMSYEDLRSVLREAERVSGGNEHE